MGTRRHYLTFPLTTLLAFKCFGNFLQITSLSAEFTLKPWHDKRNENPKCLLQPCFPFYPWPINQGKQAGVSIVFVVIQDNVCPFISCNHVGRRTRRQGHYYNATYPHAFRSSYYTETHGEFELEQVAVLTYFLSDFYGAPHRMRYARSRLSPDVGRAATRFLKCCFFRFTRGYGDQSSKARATVRRREGHGIIRLLHVRCLDLIALHVPRRQTVREYVYRYYHERFYCSLNGLLSLLPMC